MKGGHMKKLFNEKLLHICVILAVMLQPLIDLDYLCYDFLNSLGIPRISTIIRFLVMPALILWSFFLRDKNKKKTFILALIYGVLLGGYFILHSRQAAALYGRLELTENFRFSLWAELTYVLTLAVPYGIVYLCFNEHFGVKEIRAICMGISAIISIPIFIGDLFVFARSTYYGYTVGNIFSWFTGIYEWYHPRTLASKFFFNEGNTIGILLFMVLPLMYYFFATAETKRLKQIIGALIVIQSLSMQILATRVATYGAIVIPAIFLVLNVIDHYFFKDVPLKKHTAVLCICMALLCGAILNFTPAIQNQKVDAKNDVALLGNRMAEEGRAELANKPENMERFSDQWRNYYVFMFETYGIVARFIQSVPSMYYTEYYSYQYDPEFWTDVCFMPVFDRVSGRQMETIFFNYKYKLLTPAEKILGFGYSTFMNGSIVLEQDFKQQIYTLGYAGFALLILPWLLVCLYGAYCFLRYRKQMFNLLNVCMVVSLGAGLGSAWLSGHMLDQFITSVFMAMVVAFLLNQVQKAKVE